MGLMTFLGSCSEHELRLKPLVVALPIWALATCSMAYGSIRYTGLDTAQTEVPVVTAGDSDSLPMEFGHAGTAVPTSMASQHSPVVAPPNAFPRVSGDEPATGYTAWKQPVPTVSQQGVGYISRNTSFGMGLPVKAALEMILPKGWRIYAKPGVSAAAPVTWKSKNERWTITLTDVLRQAGLNAVVNWPHQALLLSVRPIPKTPALDTKGYAHWSTNLPSHFHVGHAVHSTENLSVPAVPSLANATPVFLLNSGDLILTDLQKWAKQSGWTVIWQVPEDWQVPNTTSFSGDFQKAVSQVIQALSANGANVHAVFHTANNTVVISGAGGGE